jgi:putative membrane protein
MERRWLLPLVLLGVILTLALLVAAFVGSGDGRGDWHDWGWGVGWMWVMPLFMIAFWGLVIWGVVTIVQGFSRDGSYGAGLSPGDSALEILKRRYARGDISKEEYEEKKRDLV